MRINLTKKEIINSIYMQIGFSKKISENLLEDIFQILLKNIMSEKKVKIAKNETSISLDKKIIKEEHKLYPAAILKIFN